jgi:hypothetical protein
MVFAWPEDRTVTHIVMGGCWFVLPLPIVVPAGHNLEIAMIAAPSDVDRLLAELGIPVVTQGDPS